MKKLLFIWAVCLLLLSAASAIAESTAVMVYMCGSNLESLYGSATNDLQEMLLSGLNAGETQVFIMTGGSREWMDGTISAEETRIYTLSAKAHGSGLKMKLLDSAPSRNMGEAETLSYFLHFCAEYGEADRRDLILWDHGGGPVNGVCWDENFGTDHLSLEEITAALSQSPFSQDKLEWIGFDACLMSSVEVASKLAPYAKYMISSQAEEPASGWDYSFLKGLENDAGGGATGQRIIDAFFAVKHRYNPDLTLSCVDLSAIAQIEESMNEMYAGMAARLTPDSFSALARMRIKATGYGKSAGEARSSNGYDLVDIVSLTESYASQDALGAEKVNEAVERAVVYSRFNVPGSSGLSVYHPYRNQNRFTSEWRDNYAQLGFCPGYTAYVNAYGQIMTGAHIVRWNGLNDIHASEDGAVVTLNLTQEQAENLSSARLIVLARNLYDTLDKAYFRVYSTADVTVNGTQVSSVYNGTSLLAMNEAGYSPLTGAVSYHVSEEGLLLVNLYPVDENLKRAEKPVIAEYMIAEDGHLELKGYAAYDEMTGAYSRRADVDLSQYQGITFLNEYRVPTMNELGEYAAFDEWEDDAHTSIQWKSRWDIDRTDFVLALSADEVMGEALCAAYEITDTQGNVYMTQIVPLNRGGVTSYETECEVGPGVPYIRAKARANGGQRLEVALEAANQSQVQQSYSVDGLRVNGVDIPGSWFIADQDGQLKILNPNESAAVLISLEADTLRGLGVSGAGWQITGFFHVYGAETAGGYQFDFLVETEASPTGGAEEGAGRAGEENGWTDAALQYPMLGREKLNFSSFLVSRPGEFAEDSYVIVNFTLENTAGADIHYILQNVKLNGLAADAQALNFEGSGPQDFTGRRMAAAGEKSAASLLLGYEDISRIIPDVALTAVSCDLRLYASAEEGSRPVCTVPIKMLTYVPLATFYNDAAVLPEQDVVLYGWNIGAFNPRNAQTLFSHQGCSVDLAGVFVVERSFVLLLNVKNKTDADWNIYLSQARIDEKEAQIGCTINAFVKARNNRVRSLGAGNPLWEAETGAEIQVKARESKYLYVSVASLSQEQAEARGLSFHAYMNDSNNAQDCAYFDRIQIVGQEDAPLQEGIAAVAPASDYTVTAGQPLPAENRGGVIASEVRTDNARSRQPVFLRVTMPEGEKMAASYYVLLRKVRSDAELAEMNILNERNLETMQVQLSFADGREWLIYDTLGEMQVAEDGKSAWAEYPGLRPVVCAGEESMPVLISEIVTERPGIIDFYQYGGHLSFSSTVVPGAVLGYGVSAQLAYDVHTGSAALAQVRETEEKYDYLSGLVTQRLRAVPADASLEDIVKMLNLETIGASPRQIQYLHGGQAQFALEPVLDWENYYVTFYYLTAEGQIKCTPPQPLSSFQAAP